MKESFEKTGGVSRKVDWWTKKEGSQLEWKR